MRNIRKQKKRSIFSFLENFLTKTPISQGVSSKYLPVVCYIFVLMLIYIANAHYHQKLYRKIRKLEKITEDLRVSYISLKSTYKYNLRRSEIIKKLKQLNLNLEESKISPYKIIY